MTFGVFNKVTISDSTIKGGANAGGLIGSAGYEERSTDGDASSMVSYGWGKFSPIKLTDCSYSKITVSAWANAGGFAGKVGNGESGIWVTEDKTIASDSTIKGGDGDSDNNESNSIGGVFGLVGCVTCVNTGQGDSASQVATMSNVSVTSENSASRSDGNTRGCGSVVGHAENVVTVNRIKVTSTRDVSGAILLI